jgi:hypothetical protein
VLVGIPGFRFGEQIRCFPRNLRRLLRFPRKLAQALLERARHFGNVAHDFLVVRELFRGSKPEDLRFLELHEVADRDAALVGHDAINFADERAVALPLYRGHEHAPVGRLQDDADCSFKTVTEAADVNRLFAGAPVKK